MKKALGFKNLRKSLESNDEKGSSNGRKKKYKTVGELVRVQMGVSEQVESRIRRGLLRIAASQMGRRVESMVLPLELLQQFKPSDFQDQQEYNLWQIRNLKILEEGLLMHPLVPLQKSDLAAQRLRQIIRMAADTPLDTGKNSESMQVLRNSVTTLASRSSDGYTSETCHWADGSPLNLHLYQMLLETCFNSEEGSIIEEIDEVLETIKKTWVLLGINQKLHNLIFLWITFQKFVTTGQVDADLLCAADSQLGEVVIDAKSTKDSTYSKVLSSTLSAIMGWAEKRLLAYHDTFNPSNIELMEHIVSLGVSSAKVLMEDVSNEYRRPRREETDVAKSRVDTYIRSSVRTVFAQKMEQADISRRSKDHSTPTPLLAILAKDASELANKEKIYFSPILKNWHPLAAGVAAATLHSCYGNELKQFLSEITELTIDSVQVMRAADKLEKDLVFIAVEDSVDSEDGGKALIREMPPYDAESAISDLVKKWIQTKVDRLKEWVDRNFQLEIWNPKANKENIAPSSVDILRMVDETLDAFFQLPIPTHPACLPKLLTGLDKNLQYYISKVRSGCGTRNTFIPALPALTRCDVKSSLWKKKDKSPVIQKGKKNGEVSHTLQQLCVKINTLHHIQIELENFEKKIKTCLRNVESANSDVLHEFDIKFDLSAMSIKEGIQQMCEATAYRVTFHDLRHVLYDGLYISETTSSRIYPLLKELENKLETLSSTLHNRVRNRAVTALMKASFDGFLLAILAGGPSRNFTLEDSELLEDDFRAMKELYIADGDGLPEEVVDKAASQVRNVLLLFRTDTDSLIGRYKRMIVEAYGNVAKSRYPLPPTSGQWSPTDANTVLRVLCYRKDEGASKFLKKTYGFPKKL